MNKSSNIYKYIFCFINALIGLFTIKFHYTMLDLFGKNNEVYLDKFKLTDILIFILFFIIWLVLFYILDKLLNKIKTKKRVFNISNKKLFIICMIIFLVLWSPYYLSYMPGGVYSDTYQQLKQAIYGITGNGFPVFYTLLLRLLYYISFKNTTVLFTILTIIQLILYMSIFSYFIIWLKNKKVSKLYIIICILFFALYPRIPIYALSLWKDSLFSIFLFLYILKLYDVIESKGIILEDNKEVIKYILLCVLVALFRNNGYYIIFILSGILFIKYRDNIKLLKPFYIGTSITLLLCVCTYNILFPILGYKTPYKENIGVNIQQIAYVIANEDNIDDKALETINNIIPIEVIKDNYTPMNVDSLKTLYAFNDDYLNKHKLEFWSVYFKLMFRYPKDYMKALLFNNVGFWNYYLTSYYSGSNSLIDYYEVTDAPTPDEGDISNNTDIFNNIFGFSIRNKLYDITSYLNNCAIGSLIVFISIYILLVRRKMDRFILYLPSLFIFFILFIEAPVAFSSRYIIYTIFFIPLSIIIPFIDNKKRLRN